MSLKNKKKIYCILLTLSLFVKKYSKFFGSIFYKGPFFISFFNLLTLIKYPTDTLLTLASIKFVAALQTFFRRGLAEDKDKDKDEEGLG